MENAIFITDFSTLQSLRMSQSMKPFTKNLNDGLAVHNCYLFSF